MPKDTAAPVNVEATGRVESYDDWPWGWGFRNNCRYKNRESEEEAYDESDVEESEHRGRSLRRKTSNDSLLSICLSEANEQYQQEAASRSSSISARSERYESPFRPESPYAPPSPFQGETSYGDPVLVKLGQVRMRRHSNSRSHKELSSSSAHRTGTQHITDFFERAAVPLDSPYLLASMDRTNSSSGVRDRKHRLLPSEAVDDLITPVTIKRARNTVPNSRDVTRQNQESCNVEVNRARRLSQRHPCEYCDSSFGIYYCFYCLVEPDVALHKLCGADQPHSLDYSQPELLFLSYIEPPMSSLSSSVEPTSKFADRHPKNQERVKHSVEHVADQQYLGGKPRKDSNGQSNNFSEAFAEVHGDASELSNKFVNCRICQKFAGRPYDLKKHMRRHERPYGCTFQGCLKTFGSKNDWKRHEISQHLRSTHWRCDVQVSHNGKEMPYGEQHNLKSYFYRHLELSHRLKWKKAFLRAEQCKVEKSIENFQTGFWCGFCR